MFSKRKLTVTWLAITLAVFAAGCKKKAPPPPPPPPPAPVERTLPPTPNAPTVAQFSAEPTSIQRGQSSTLRWEVSGDVTNVSIDQAVGTVQNTGSRAVSPANSTTYTLTATGPGGRTTASATASQVTVNFRLLNMNIRLLNSRYLPHTGRSLLPRLVSGCTPVPSDSMV